MCKHFFTYWQTEILEDPEPGPQCTRSSFAHFTYFPACSDFLGLIWLFWWKTVYSLSPAVLHPYTEAFRSSVASASVLKMCFWRRTHGYLMQTFLHLSFQELSNKTLNKFVYFFKEHYADLPRLSCEGGYIHQQHNGKPFLGQEQSLIVFTNEVIIRSHLEKLSAGFVPAGENCLSPLTTSRWEWMPRRNSSSSSPPHPSLFHFQLPEHDDCSTCQLICPQYNCNC